MSRESLFRILAVLFFGAAGYHALAFFEPAFGNGGAHRRHAAFCGIDILFACYLMRRPKWLVWAFGVLTIEALWSHGTHAWRLWREQGRLDWLSFAVLIVVPCAQALLTRDALDRRASSSA